MMAGKVLYFLLVVVAVAAARMAVTQEFTDYLKSRADWEVVDYENNIFKGWTLDEFKKILGDEDMSGVEFAPRKKSGGRLPEFVDNRELPCVHPVKDQGRCGSCWAFATASVVSDTCCLAGKKQPDNEWMSVQELVSCDTTNSGCDGGLASRAINYVRSNGLVPDSCFTYTQKEESCPTKCADGKDFDAAHVCKPQSVTNCDGFNGIKECISKDKSVAVRMRVYSDFMNYKSGIYCYTSGEYLGGHAIRAIGYGTSPKNYVLCANSWSSTWGDNGYFKIEAREECGLRLGNGDSWTASGYGNCKYGECDASLPEGTCLDDSAHVVKLKQCPAGKTCVSKTCVPIPKVYYDVGEKAPIAEDCYTGILDEKGYCKGVPLGSSCDSTMKKKCDGGLFCNAFRCEEMRKEGEKCTGEECLPNLSCYPDGICRPWYSLEVGSKTYKELHCKTDLLFSGLCGDYQTHSTPEWVSYQVNELRACKYSGLQLWDADCVFYSEDMSKVGHCPSFDQTSKSVEAIKKYFEGYQPDMCPQGNPFCAKAWEQLGACPYKEALKRLYNDNLRMEEVFPDCWEKKLHNMIDAIPCSASGVILGALTFLGIMLLLQLSH